MVLPDDCFEGTTVHVSKGHEQNRSPLGTFDHKHVARTCLEPPSSFSGSSVVVNASAPSRTICEDSFEGAKLQGRVKAAPPDSFEGATVEVRQSAPSTPRQRPPPQFESSAERAWAREVARAQAGGMCAGLKPTSSTGWNGAPQGAGASAASIARRAAGGQHPRHFFGEPVWPSDRGTARPFSGPHALSSRGEAQHNGSFECNSSMAVERPQPPARPQTARTAGVAPVAKARELSGLGDVMGSGCVFSGGRPAPTTPRGRGAAAGLQATFGGASARALIAPDE